MSNDDKSNSQLYLMLRHILDMLDKVNERLDKLSGHKNRMDSIEKRQDNIEKILLHMKESITVLECDSKQRKEIKQLFTNPIIKQILTMSVTLVIGGIIGSYYFKINMDQLKHYPINIIDDN